MAVQGFSLIVNRNECFGLLGPNGKCVGVVVYSNNSPVHRGRKDNINITTYWVI